MMACFKDKKYLPPGSEWCNECMDDQFYDYPENCADANEQFCYMAVGPCAPLCVGQDNPCVPEMWKVMQCWSDLDLDDTCDYACDSDVGTSSV